MNKTNWKPTASLEILKANAHLIDNIRYFFTARSLLEVTTPLLGDTSVTDPYIDSIATNAGWLQTSPEYMMKRLLAAYQTDIFQICKAFRKEEIGSQHQIEFTLLEWYRIDFDHHALMDEVDLFLQTILDTPKAQRFTYQQLFMEILNIDPMIADLKTIHHIATQHNIDTQLIATSVDEGLIWLFHQCIEPTFTKEVPTFVYDYPAGQAALARLNAKYPQTAARFEVYLGGYELANGFHELADEQQQHQRFLQNNQKRISLHKPSMAIDQHLLSALGQGFPPCSGVALGIDRLLMIKHHQTQIENVMSFKPCC